MVRQAQPPDIDGVMAVIEDSREIMQAGGNFQWDENYPQRKDFENDITEGTLFVIDEAGVVAGVICINTDEPESYSEAFWKSGGDALVIHRMAVSPKCRGRGFAGELLGFAVKLAAEKGISSVRTDTFSGNIPMNTLFVKHGFQKTGVVELEGKKNQPFYCYEKVLRKISEI